MSLVCHRHVTRMSSACHSYVLVCCPYVTRTRMYFYVIRMSLASSFTMNRMNPVKRVRWTFSRKYLTIFSRYLLLRKVPSKMFDRFQNTTLEYAHFVYIAEDQFVTVICFKGFYRRFK